MTKIEYGKIQPPKYHDHYEPVDVDPRVMRSHCGAVLERMKDWGLDALVIYADREHGANFAYLTGFEPRFEEALLVLFANGEASYLLGNENLKMANYSFVSGKVIHVPFFSLPCQPMVPDRALEKSFYLAGIRSGMKIGCVGWKYFTGGSMTQETWVDIPHYIIRALKNAAGNAMLKNVAGIFMDPDKGLRYVRTASEIAGYEYGAGLASVCIYNVLNHLEPGMSEAELADFMHTQGQPVTVTTICAAGERFTNAVVFPRNKRVAAGDRFSVTLGLRGGLTSRAAYAALGEEDLPEGQKDYLEKVVIPYYRAAVTWYETVGIGVTGGELYEKIEGILPKEEYGWTLNPGHYTGNEEWTGSPVFLGSTVKLRSGMLLQMDIIPGVKGYAGVGAEDGIAIADEKLQEEIALKYPAAWERFMERRAYMSEVLGIRLKKEILPMSDLCGYLRPYMLDRERALYCTQ